MKVDVLHAGGCLLTPEALRAAMRSRLLAAR